MLKNVLFVFAALPAFSIAFNWEPGKKSGSAIVTNVDFVDCAEDGCGLDKNLEPIMRINEKYNEITVSITFNNTDNITDFAPKFKPLVSGSCEIHSNYSSTACDNVKARQNIGDVKTKCPLKKDKVYIFNDAIEYGKECGNSGDKTFKVQYELLTPEKDKSILQIYLELDIKH